MPVVVHDPGGRGFRIERLFAFVAVHDDGDESVVAVPIGPGGSLMPLVGADEARLADLRPLAERAARMLRKPVRLVWFETRRDGDLLQP